MQLEAAGAALGLVLGLAGGKLADVLPRRYEITHVAPSRVKRNAGLAILSALVGAGVGHVLTSASLSLGDATFLLAVNASLAAIMLAASAIDLEHMILPNELTFGATAIALLSSPLRNVRLTGSLIGAVAGFVLAYVPFVLYKRIKGQSGMGLGDAKLAIAAGAWLGMEGAVFVLFAGALQQVLAAVVMRVFGLHYAIPESVRAEIAALRAKAAAGDKEAAGELADDPMAADLEEGTMNTRLPLGPFLGLACLEALFLRRWLIDYVFSWLLR